GSQLNQANLCGADLRFANLYELF
ncbi:MAG: pentapeptide repeat-containing protein, partial [bacterium]